MEQGVAGAVLSRLAVHSAERKRVLTLSSNVVIAKP